MISVLIYILAPTLAYTAQVTKVFCICVLSLTGLLSMCVELALGVLLMIRVLKFFLTPTLTYTTKLDESMLHVCFDSNYFIGNMR